MRRLVAVVALCVLAACGGDDDNGEVLAAVCDDFHALVEDGERLPGDWSAFEPVIDRADDVDELEDPAGNIREAVAHVVENGDVEVAGLEPAVEGFYNRCQNNGWNGLDD